MFQAFHLVDVRRKGTKDSLDDNGTQPGTLIEEDRIQNWGAAAGEPTQLHLVDEVTGADTPVNTVYQAQLTCVNSEQQPYCAKYSKYLYFALGETEAKRGVAYCVNTQLMSGRARD